MGLYHTALLNTKSDPKVALNINMVELVENSLHSLTEELQRWQGVIGRRHIDTIRQLEANRVDRTERV